MAAQTQAAEIEVTVTRAVETDHLVKNGGPHIEERVHFGLKDY